MSIERPTTNERQCMEMMRACIRQGVTIAFIRECIDMLEGSPRAQQIARKEQIAADERAVLATSRSIADNAPEEPGPTTGVRRRAPAMKKRSATKARP